MKRPRYAHIVPPVGGRGAKAATSVSARPVAIPAAQIRSDSDESWSRWRAKTGETFIDPNVQPTRTSGDAVSAPTRFLGPVHRAIGSGQQLFGRFGLGKSHRDADAGAHFEAVIADLDGFVDRGDELGRERLGVGEDASTFFWTTTNSSPPRRATRSSRRVA